MLDLKRDLVIIGQTVGTHQIRDLKITIKYGQAIRLTAKQVSKSKDLIRDLKDRKIMIDERLYGVSTEGREKESVQTEVIKTEVSTLKEVVGVNSQSITQLTTALNTIVSEIKEIKESLKHPIVAAPGVEAKSDITREVVTMIVNTLRDDLKSIGLNITNKPVVVENVPQYIPTILTSKDVLSTNITIANDSKTSDINDKLSRLKGMKRK